MGGGVSSGLCSTWDHWTYGLSCRANGRTFASARKTLRGWAQTRDEGRRTLNSVRSGMSQVGLPSGRSWNWPCWSGLPYFLPPLPL
eukprot:scaffold10435_cov60-Phaeocystis_antarctica.AAC.5